jgi:hypothetical protein
MDTSTALQAAAIGAGASLATIALFGAVAGRRFRSRARAMRGFGGPAFAQAGPGGRCAHHAKFAMAGGHGHWQGRCARRGDVSDATATDADAAASEPAEA